MSAKATLTDQKHELQFYAEVELIQDFVSGMSDKPIKMPLFHSEITIFDETKTAWANQEIKVNATRYIGAKINGTYFAIDEKAHTATVMTDGAGRLRVITEAKGVDAAELLLHADFMESDQRILIRPAQTAQQKLASLDGRALGKATDYQKKSILKSDFQGDEKFLDAAAGTIKATVDMARYSQAKTRDSQNHSGHHCCDDCDDLTCCCCSAGSHACDVSNNSSFAVSFRDNLAQKEVNFYPDMSQVEVDNWIAARKVSQQFEDGEWNIWEELKKDACAIGDAIVYVYDEVKEAVKVVVTILVEEAGKVLEYVAEAVVETIEQGLILVQSIFDEITVEASKVLEWLSEVFDFDRVIEIKDIVSTTLSESLAKIGTAPEIDALEAKLISQFEHAREDVDGFFDDLEAKIGNQTTEKARNEAYKADTGQENMASGGVTGNWLFEKIASPVGKHTENRFIFPIFNPGELKEDLKDVVTSLSGHITGDIAEALDNLRLITESKASTDIFTAAASAVIELIRAAAKVVVDVIGDLVTGLLKLVKKIFGSSAMADWLNGRVDIPIVTSLYKSLTKEKKMTALDLVGFMVGFSGMLYEKAKGEIVFKKANNGQTDPDTVAAVANWLQILSGSFGILEQTTKGDHPTPDIRLTLTSLARAAYFHAILLKYRGRTLTTILLLWAMPTLNLVKDIGFHITDKNKATANTLAAAFGFGLVTIYGTIAIDPTSEVNDSTIFFAFIVSVSLLIAPCANTPSDAALLSVARNLLIVFSGAFGLAAKVVETPDALT